MKSPFKAVALGLLLASCSSPSQDGTSADSTSLAADSVASPRQPAQSVSSNNNALSLTPEEQEQVNWELFLWLHNYETLFADNDVMAYKEEFNANGNHFSYELLRHNTTRRGYHTHDDFWTLAYDPSDAISIAESKKEQEYFDMDDDGDIDAEDSASQPDRIDHRRWDLYDGAFINDIDTLRGEGTWSAYPDDGPESQIRKVKIVTEGLINFMNVNYQLYGEVKRQEDSDRIDALVVELGAPRKVGRDELYLKAKVAQLTDKDLAGMNKDDLGYLRNEIFARHGHTFKTDKMKNYFASKEWYHSLIDDAASLLNKFEKQNVEFIKRKEG